MTQLRYKIDFTKSFAFKPIVYYANEAERIKLKYKKSQTPKVKQFFQIHFLFFNLIFTVSLE